MNDSQEDKKDVLVLTAEDYQMFRDNLKSISGILLGESKKDLVVSRLANIITDNGLKSFSELLRGMESNPALRENIMDSITTCENSWFRDSFPFYLFKEKLLPTLAMAQPQRIRVWSAGCFVGEEPYLLSMAAEEYFQGRPGSLPPGAVTILGTDISSRSINKAIGGLYENIAVSRGLPPEKKQKYFQPIDGKWKIIDSIRNRVTFAKQNLLEDFKHPGMFDVIFCRNVLTYFASDVRRDILSRLTKTLTPGGYIVLGKTESIANHSDQFEQIQWRDGVFYRLKS